MKKQKLITLFIIVTLFFSCNSENQNEENIEFNCIPLDLENSVVAIYPFTNGSLNDFSGNNENLSNTTTANSTSDRNGNENCAFEFDFLSGTNEFLSTSNTSTLDNLTDFSISLWYQPLETRDDGDFELLIGRDHAYNYPTDTWYLGLHDCRKASFSYTSQVWDNDPDFNCGISDLDNNWHHLVATFESSTSTMKLYRNRDLQESTDQIYFPDASQMGNLQIGNFFTGKIDDIIILNKSLNQTEVNSLFDIGSCCN